MRAVIQTRNFEEAKYLLFATKNGVVKKTELAAYNTPLKADGIIAIKMREGDELVGVRHASGDDDILMVSRERPGDPLLARRDVRAMGRDASGVAGHAAARRRRGDLGRRSPRDDADLLVVTENGYGKRTRVSEYPTQGPRRHGREDRAADRGARPSRRRARRPRRLPGDADLDRRHRDPMPVEDVKRLGRSTQGVIVMRLREGELVSSLAPVVESATTTTTVDTGRGRPTTR